MESFTTIVNGFGRQLLTEAVTGGVLLIEMFLKISRDSQENISIRVFIKKETPVQVFYCDFCKICKNTIFTEHLLLLYHSVLICSILDVCGSHAYVSRRFWWKLLLQKIPFTSSNTCTIKTFFNKVAGQHLLIYWS